MEDVTSSITPSVRSRTLLPLIYQTVKFKSSGIVIVIIVIIIVIYTFTGIYLFFFYFLWEGERVNEAVITSSGKEWRKMAETF